MEMGRKMNMESRAIINEIINEVKISRAIRSFYPYKSAGPDDIRPILVAFIH